MKKQQQRAGMRIAALDSEQLRAATGGRGSYCGTVFHCDCGYTGDLACNQSDNGWGYYYYYNCPGCGADPAY